MQRRSRLAQLVVWCTAVAATSCKDDSVDYVKVVVRSTEVSLASSALELDVDVQGGGRITSFHYRTAPKTAPERDPRGFAVSDFTVSFDSAPSNVADVVVRTRPSGEAVDWGGEAQVVVPGGGRSVAIPISRGEAPLQNILVLDGDLQTAATYGGQLVLGWPAIGTTGGLNIIAIDPERPQGLERPGDPIGRGATKVRVTSRPSADGTSELFATTWIQDGAQPILRVQSRTEKPDAPETQPRVVATGLVATDIHAACARRELTPPIVTAVLADGRVQIATHDETGAATSAAATNPDLDRVNRIVGIAVTPDDTVTLAVNGSFSRLLQISTKTGETVHAERLDGTAVALSPTADGTRLLVATVVGTIPDTRLQVETFSVRQPTRTEAPSALGDYPLVPGVPASRVSLASCGIAWPVLRGDGSTLTDVRYQLLDVDGRPLGDPHGANVARVGHHFAPTVVCLSPTRAFITFFEANTTGGPVGRLVMRRLPTEVQ